MRRSRQTAATTDGNTWSAMMALSDAALVAGSQRDPNAFSFLFERYWEPVFRYCFYRTGNWHQAEDIASQVFIRSLAALPRFDDRGQSGSFRSWLFSIAHNLVIDAGRTDAKRPETRLEFAAHLASNDLSPEEEVINRETHRFAYEVLLRLPTEQREVLELRLAGLSSTEIARVIGRKPGAVRVAQHRAMEALRQALKIEPQPEIEEQHA